MSQLSVRDAAYRVGITRQTLFKYIRQGKVSATIGKDGQKQIDVSELIRAFGELQPEPVTNGHSSDSRTLSPNTAATRDTASPSTSTSTATLLQLELERLKSQLHFKEAELALAKERIDELKAREQEAKHRERESTEERMRMLGVIETQNRLLAAPPIPVSRRPVRQAPVKKNTEPVAKVTLTTPAPAKKSKTATSTPNQAASKSAKNAEKKASKTKASKKAR